MEKKIIFKNSKGDKLCGLLSSIDGSSNRPVIILVHGFSSNKNTSNFVKLKNILDEKGIATFRFDIFGHGESEGNFEDITITEAVDDIRQAIKFLKTKGYSKIGLLGSSFGGMASIMTASRTQDLFMLALKSPVSDMDEEISNIYLEDDLKKWKNDGYIYHNDGGKSLKLGYSFVDDFKNNNAYLAAEKITIPTLIVHGDADQTVPITQSVKTSKIIPVCKLLVIKNANHSYSKGDHAEQMLQAFSEFIESESRKYL